MEAWTVIIIGDPWFIVTFKLKRVKYAMRKLNHECGNVHKVVITARNDLLLFQDSMPNIPNSALRREDDRLCSNLREALNIEEVMLKQKSLIK